MTLFQFNFLHCLLFFLYNPTISLSLSLYIYIYITIYTLLSRWLCILAKELTEAIRIMQNSSNELSTPVSDNAECMQTKTNKNAVISQMGVGPRIDCVVRYQVQCKVWRVSIPAWNHSTCLATLMSCDTTKQSLFGWQYMNMKIFVIYTY